MSAERVRELVSGERGELRVATTPLRKAATSPIQAGKLLEACFEMESLEGQQGKSWLDNCSLASWSAQNWTSTLQSPQPCFETSSQHITHLFNGLQNLSVIPDIMSATAMFTNNSTALLQGRITAPRAAFRARIAPALPRRGRVQITKAGEPFYSVGASFHVCLLICPSRTDRNPWLHSAQSQHPTSFEVAAVATGPPCAYRSLSVCVTLL